MDIPPGLFNAVGVPALTAFIFWMLTTGRLCTGRELVDKDRRIDAQARMIEELTDQNRMLLNETIPTITSVLVAFREAAGKQEP
jgi:hypothetical protein